MRDIFPRLTVLENIEMGGYTLPRSKVRDRVEEVMELYPQLRPLAGRQGGHLSGGERKMLAIARAMMIRPALLVLDEPTAGLAPKPADELLGKHVAALAGTGLSVLMVEQRAREAMAISHRAYVMAAGRVVLTDRADAVLARPDLGEVFLGRPALHVVSARRQHPGVQLAPVSGPRDRGERPPGCASACMYSSSGRPGAKSWSRSSSMMSLGRQRSLRRRRPGRQGR